MTEERKVIVYNCIDGYVVHDKELRKIYVYTNVERANSSKTVREVMREL